MKFKRKIRKPKKAKKVTLARIREIVKEELAALSAPLAFNLTEEQRKELEQQLRTELHPQLAYEDEPMYFPPATIRPVHPPPHVSTRKLSIFPPLALPDCFEDEEEINLNAPCW